MNINLKFLLLGTSLSLIPNLLYAQCTTTPDCATMGYKETTNKGGCLKCPTGNGWYCPCDTSYQYTCTGANEQQGTDKCGDKYKSCTCVSGYEWKDGKCEKEIQPILGQCTGYAKNCKIGDILNSDGTCTTNKVSNKNPIGVVAYIGSDGCGQALALTDLSNEFWMTTDAPYLPLPTYDTFNLAAQNDFDSCYNTQQIVKLGNSSDFPAAWSAIYYSPEKARETKGKWCVPAAGIAQSIIKNHEIINKSLKSVNATSLANGNTTLGYYIWTSSLLSKTGSAWRWKPYDDSFGYIDYSYGSTHDDAFVRPVIEF